MKKAAYFAAAALCAGAVGYWSSPVAIGADEGNSRSQQQSVQSNAPLALPTGFQQKDIKEDKDIRSEFATLTEDALKKDHFDNFLNNLVDQDRNRMKNEKDRNVADLNGKINVIQKFWHDKYGHDFNIKDAKDLYTNIALMTGEVTDSAQAVANWPVDPKTGQAEKKSSEAVAASAHETGKPFGGDVNLEKGRNVALARIEGSHGLPAVTASLIHEKPDQWRFDIPNSRTGEQIYNDLLNQLNFVATNSEKWPSDEQEAYRMVTHHVVLALYGVDAHMQASGDRAHE